MLFQHSQHSSVKKQVNMEFIKIKQANSDFLEIRPNILLCLKQWSNNDLGTTVNIVSYDLEIAKGSEVTSQNDISVEVKGISTWITVNVQWTSLTSNNLWTRKRKTNSIKCGHVKKKKKKNGWCPAIPRGYYPQNKKEFENVNDKELDG